MSNLSPTEAFQQRMFERMRDDMGKLMSDEDLKKLPEASMHKAFFERRVTKDAHNYTTSDKEPLIVELVREALRPAVAAAAEAYVAAHHEETQKLLDECLKQGFVGIVVNWFQSRTAMPMAQLASDMERVFNLQPR